MTTIPLAETPIINSTTSFGVTKGTTRHHDWSPTVQRWGCTLPELHVWLDYLECLQTRYKRLLQHRLPYELTLLVVISSLLFVWLLRSSRKPPNFPPGPSGWPIIGDLDILFRRDMTLQKFTQTMGRIYGPVIGFKFGSIPVVLVGSIDKLKEVISECPEAITVRPRDQMQITTDVFTLGGHIQGLTWSNGKDWKDLRKFSMRYLKNFGMGKREFEPEIKDEAKLLVQELLKYEGKPLSPEKIVQVAVANVIARIMFSKRFSFDDKEYLQVLDSFEQFSRAPMFLSPFNFLLSWLIGWKIVKDTKDALEHIDIWLEKQAKMQMPTFHQNTMRNFADFFLMKDQENEPEGNLFHRRNVRRLLADVYKGGTQTTFGTMLWTLIYLIRNPEVQKRCREEIGKVVGFSQEPSYYKHRADLPYTVATVRETQRLCSIAPITAHGVNEKAVNICGYTVPAGTLILVNIMGIHTDPDYWQDPFKFNPDRWLDAEGKLKDKQAFIPFTTGPRSCIGEQLSKVELFVFTATLLQQLTFRVVDRNKLPSMETRAGAILLPEPFQLIVESG